MFVVQLLRSWVIGGFAAVILREVAAKAASSAAKAAGLLRKLAPKQLTSTNWRNIKGILADKKGKQVNIKGNIRKTRDNKG